jgi:hypothetical protein
MLRTKEKSDVITKGNHTLMTIGECVLRVPDMAVNKFEDMSRYDVHGIEKTEDGDEGLEGNWHN